MGKEPEIIELAKRLRFLLVRDPENREEVLTIVLRGDEKCEKECCNYGQNSLFHGDE